MKRILSLLLAALLVIVPFTYNKAEAASTFVPSEGTVVMLNTGDKAYAIVDKGGNLKLHYMDYDTESFTYTNASVSRELMSGVKMIVGEGRKLMVLKEDGSLWAYRFGYEREEVFGPLKLMDGVAKISDNGAYHCSVLTAGGILTDIEFAFATNNGEPVASEYKIQQIDTGIADVSANGYYVKGNEVRRINNAQSKVEYTLDFSNGEKVWNYNGSWFVCTDNGDLWSWGSNVRGQLGNGGEYDGAGSIMFVGSFQDGVMAYPITNSKPTKILTNVENMWFGDGEIRAVDSNGTVWQWGDGENIMTFVEQVSDTSYSIGELEYPQGFPDSLGYKPREVTPDEWTNVIFFDRISFRQDGSIWVKANSEGEYVRLATWTGESANPVTTPVYYDSPTGFTDIRPGYYCEEPVIWAVNNGVTTGTTATTFSPDDTCTQAQIVTFLWRAAGSPRPNEENVIPFAGVKDQYYYKPILWVLQSELADKVVAEDDCLRSDVVLYLWKLAGKPSAGYSSFSDVNEYDIYAEAVAWAVEEGITTGTSATTFSPNDTCTRGQIVTFLYRYFTRVEEPADIVLS